MKKLLLIFTGLLLLTGSGLLNLCAQELKPEGIVFRNAPVLFRKDKKLYQQILAVVKSEKPGKISFSVSGKEILGAEIKTGENKYLLTIPAVHSQTNIKILAKTDNSNAVYYPFTVKPPEKWEIYLVQHSHTDIGYTRPQSEILAEQMRYIDYALDYCDNTDSLPDYARFRWTCESSWVTREYMRSRPSSQIERFRKRIKEGRIEVTGMFANMAEIADENIMFDFLKPLGELKKEGIPVKLAMQNDVNGIAWCMPDYFKNSGIKYLIMGINETRSILPFDKPTCFWWESPAGERLLAFRGDHYMTGNFFGLESESIKAENMLWHLAELERKEYPFHKIGIQFSGYFTDNAPPSTVACNLVKEWNEKYEYPKLRLSLASEFPEYVEKNFGQKLPVYRKAWLDWWTDGYGSTSRETAEIRKTQNLKQADEGLFAMVAMMNGELPSGIGDKIDHISESAIFFDEHTCGAAESIDLPFSVNSTRQWLQKGAYAWEALKKATLLNEEALARFQQFLPKNNFPVIYIINTMGWTRSGNAELFIDYEIMPPGKKVRIIDMSTGKEVPFQMLSKRAEGAYWVLQVNDIPAMGAKALKVEVTEQKDLQPVSENSPSEILENNYYKIVIDRETGSIISLLDKELNLELADNQNRYHLGQLVHETLPGRNMLKPSQTSITNVRIVKGTEGQVWESVLILADMQGLKKGTTEKPEGAEIEIRLYRNTKKVELSYMARKEIVTDPEALYVAFPFFLPDSRIVFETIGGSLSQGSQLQGSSSDWNVAQNFVAVRGKKGQIVVVSNEIPLWQFSDFNIGKFERYPKPGKTWLYSWVMNNYWFTNFRAFQEGAFTWSYQITSSGDTSSTFATKYAWSERNPYLSRTLPAGGKLSTQPEIQTLKISGSKNIITVNVRPVFNARGDILFHFRELEGIPSEIRITSAIPGRPVSKMFEVNALGQKAGEEINSIKFKPYEVKFIEVEF
jgi:hypothetical protein